MALANRVKRLERTRTKCRNCSTCYGEGKFVVSEMNDGDLVVPTTDGCPECGKANRMLLVWVDESFDGKALQR